MKPIILTSSFATVSDELLEKGMLPQHASVVFVPVASAVYEETPWIDEDRKKLEQFGYTVIDVDIRNVQGEELRNVCDDADIIFIAGGNTVFLYHHAQQSGLYDIIQRAVQDGTIYVGSSAGSILAGPSVEPFLQEDMPELPKDFHLEDPTGLNLVDYIILPHYKEGDTKDKEIMERYGSKFHFVLLTDKEYRLET